MHRPAASKQKLRIITTNNGIGYIGYDFPLVYTSASYPQESATRSLCVRQIVAIIISEVAPATAISSLPYL